MRKLFALLCLTAVGLFAACQTPPEDPDDPVDPDDVSITYPPPITPTPLSFVCDEQKPPLPDEVLALTGGLSFENETHDCQRLVLRDGSYGPLVGIFPLDEPMDDAFTGDAAVLTLYNFDPSIGYDPLFVSGVSRLMWSCLFLHKFTPGDTLGTAHVFRLVNNNGCHETNGTPIGTLTVRISSHPDVTSMPSSARFRWDDVSKSHYLGFRCGRHWCSAYAEGVTPSEPVAWTSMVDVPVESVPGYGDQQHLAILHDSDPSTIRPGPLATIIPDSTLSDMEMSDFLSGPIRVATIRVEEDPGDFDQGWTNYRDKFGLAGRDLDGDGAPDEWVTDLWIDLEVVTTGATTDTIATGFFGEDPTALAKAHAAAFIPTEHGALGNARWRWLANDEGAWVYCAHGCCSVEGPS